MYPAAVAADVREVKTAIGAAPEIGATHDDNVGVRGIDPDGVIIPALPAEVIVAGVAERVGDPAIGGGKDLARAGVARGVNY